MTKLDDLRYKRILRSLGSSEQSAASKVACARLRKRENAYPARKTAFPDVTRPLRPDFERLINEIFARTIDDEYGIQFEADVCRTIAFLLFFFFFSFFLPSFPTSSNIFSRTRSFRISSQHSVSSYIYICPTTLTYDPLRLRPSAAERQTGQSAGRSRVHFSMPTLNGIRDGK